MKRDMIMALVVAMGLASSGAVGASSSIPAADDSVINGKVQAVFFREPSLRTSHLAVGTTRGVVHLSGVVEKVCNLDTAAALAASVPGVVQVKKEHVVVKQ